MHTERKAMYVQPALVKHELLRDITATRSGGMPITVLVTALTMACLGIRGLQTSPVDRIGSIGS